MYLSFLCIILKDCSHDFKENYPYVCQDTLVFMCMTDILIRKAVFKKAKKTHNDIDFINVVKLNIVVDKWLHPLNTLALKNI